MVNFYLKNDMDRRGDATIRLSVCIGGVRLLTSSGWKCPPEKWDAARQQVRRGAVTGHRQPWNRVNAALAEIAACFTEYEDKCMAERRVPTVDELRAVLAERFGRKHTAARVPRKPSAAALERAVCGKTGEVPRAERARKLSDAQFFAQAYADFVAERSVANDWTEATKQKFRALWAHLVKWRKEPTFADLTHEGLVALVVSLRETEGLKNSSIGKQLGYLKWFLNWATDKGINTNIAYKTFAPKLKQAVHRVVFLSAAEVMRLMRLEIPEGEVTIRDYDGREYVKRVPEGDGIRITRDLFCFQCFTGLRFSDVSALRRSDIRDGKLTITTQKTADTLTIEINKHAQALLDKYRDADTGGLAFPHVANQKANNYIKDLCELCGFNEPQTKTYYRGSERIDETEPKYAVVGTHTARRSFICNALIAGIPAEVVMKWTGHSDYKAMRPYIDVADTAKAAMMRRLEDIF